jgi:hypothetical protein
MITFTTALKDVTVTSLYLRRPGQKFDLRLVMTRSTPAPGRAVALERVMTDLGLDRSFRNAVSKRQEHYGLWTGRTGC